ncbi:MAG TPA: BMP family ABC transporter substrate-binding protein [Methanocorpusculum sp.]|nr:BMP family ABC transporter substrate-binding protein [Methanocorpusculum sp.]
MNRRILAILIVIILLAIPGTLLVTHGNLFPPEEKPYEITSIINDIKTDDSFTTQLIMGVQQAERLAEKEGGSVSQDVILYMEDGWKEYFDKRNPVCNLVLTSTVEISDTILEAAAANPNISYVSIDLSYGDAELPPNLENIQFRSNEPSFVAGYVAGSITETNKIGFLAGMDIPAIDCFYYGFCAGVDVAAAEQGKHIEVIRKTADTFQEENVGYYLTKQMYQSGCDICFMVAGNTGAGGMKAAEEMKKYIIGVDTDQAYLAPGWVIFSVIKDVKTAVKDKVIEHVKNGDLITGGTTSLGYTEDAVGVVSYLDTAVPSNLEERAHTVEELITNGYLEIPDNEESYQKFDANQCLKVINYVEARE